MDGVGHLEDALFYQGQLLGHTLGGVIGQSEGVRPSGRLGKVHFLYVLAVPPSLQTHGKPRLHTGGLSTGGLTGHRFQRIPLNNKKKIPELMRLKMTKDQMILVDGILITLAPSMYIKEKCDPPPKNKLKCYCTINDE